MPYIDQITRGGTTYDIQDSATKAVAEAILPMIAYEELTTTATHAYTAGNSYFTLGGVLYMATADIAIGDNIKTTGTGANAAQVPGGVTGEVADLKSALEEISANTINMWTGGDVSFTGDKIVPCSLPAGTYCISANPTSTDTDSTTCYMAVRNSANSATIASIYFKRGEYNSKSITVESAIGYLWMFAADNSAHSSGDTATYSEIQIETGAIPHSYVQPLTALDVIARQKNTQQDAEIKSLANDGTLPVNGNVHNYYIAGGAQNAYISVSNTKGTKVFPIENGKKYHVKNDGDVSVIGYANEEYISSGTIYGYTIFGTEEFDVVNSGNYKYLYVHYASSATYIDATVLCSEVSNLATKSDISELKSDITANPEISIGTPLDGYVYNLTMAVTASETVKHTDYIPVFGGREITLKNYTSVGTIGTGVAALLFDKYKNGIAVVKDSYGGGSQHTITYTLPDNVRYIVFNCIPSSYTSELYYTTSHYKWDDQNDAVLSIVNDDHIVVIGDYIDGYVYNIGGSVASSETIKHTGFIPVIGGRKIKIENYTSISSGVAVFIYDANKSGLETVTDGYGGGTKHTIEKTLPYNAAYIVFNSKPGDYTASVTYTETYHPWDHANDTINQLFTVAKKDFAQLFKQATAFPICCIIDDDTLSVASAEAFATVCENNGINGTLACLTNFLATVSGLTDKLHDLETRGHQIVIHGYTQSTFYQNAQIYGDENYKLAEEDFVKGLRDLKANDFLNYNYWVTPYGVVQECMQRLAKKWGMKCLVRTGNIEYNGTDGKYTRWELQRSGLNSTDSQGSLTLQQLMDLADDCAEHNGWLLVNTHISDGWAGDYTRINTFIDHCKDQGFVFMTLGEAWKIRKYIYDWYDTF